MSKKTTKLCKWSSDDIDKSFKKYSKQVGTAKFICTKCGRAAASEDALCKPAATTK